MKIGLTTSVGFNREAEVKAIHDEYVALLEDEVSALADKSDSVDALIDCYLGLRGSNNRQAVIDFLNRDNTFADRYGSSSEALVQMRNDINAACEGMLQDFLRWGLIGLGAGLYLSSLKRIRKICQKATARGMLNISKLDSWIARSIYLPPANEFFKLVNALQGLRNAMITFTKDPNAKVEPVVKALRAAGVDVTMAGDVSHLVGTDWKAVAGDWIGAFLLGLPGKIIGAHWASDNGETLADKGYSEGNLIKAAKTMVGLIDDIQSWNRVVPPSAQKDAEGYAAKVRFVKKAAKVYVRCIKNIGRGLATGLNHVI